MIAEVQAECKLPLVADEYVESFKPDLMDVIFSWSKVTTPPVVGPSLRHPARVSSRAEAKYVNMSPACQAES